MGVWNLYPRSLNINLTFSKSLRPLKRTDMTDFLTMVMQSQSLRNFLDTYLVYGESWERSAARAAIPHPGGVIFPTSAFLLPTFVLGAAVELLFCMLLFLEVPVAGFATVIHSSFNYRMMSTVIQGPRAVWVSCWPFLKH